MRGGVIVHFASGQFYRVSEFLRYLEYIDHTYTGQNKLSPMSIFFHRCNVHM